TLVASAVLGFAALLAPPRAPGQEAPRPLRAGIIGLDTSHVAAFTKVLNDPNAKGDLAGIRVVAAYPGGSPDVASSRDRVAGFTRQLRDEFKVEIVDSVDALLGKVDVVLLESVDGRKHLEQAEPVLRARKPVFIVLGTGCLSVARVRTSGTELVTGTWEGDRVGTFRGIRRGKADYGALAFGTKGVALAEGSGGYEPLLVEICKFFRTGRPPVD